MGNLAYYTIYHLILTSLLVKNNVSNAKVKFFCLLSHCDENVTNHKLSNLQQRSVKVRKIQYIVTFIESIVQKYFTSVSDVLNTDII